jgi:hypothetical protein
MSQNTVHRYMFKALSLCDKTQNNYCIFVGANMERGGGTCSASTDYNSTSLQILRLEGNGC